MLRLFLKSVVFMSRVFILIGQNSGWVFSKRGFLSGSDESPIGEHGGCCGRKERGESGEFARDAQNSGMDPGCSDSFCQIIIVKILPAVQTSKSRGVIVAVRYLMTPASAEI